MCVSWLGACNFVRLVTAIIVSIGYVGDRLHVGVVHGDSLNAEWTNLSTGGRCVNLSAQQGSLPSPLLAPLSFYTTVCLLSISSGRECWRPAVVSAQRDATHVYRPLATRALTSCGRPSQHIHQQQDKCAPVFEINCLSATAVRLRLIRRRMQPIHCLELGSLVYKMTRQTSV